MALGKAIISEGGWPVGVNVVMVLQENSGQWEQDTQINIPVIRTHPRLAFMVNSGSTAKDSELQVVPGAHLCRVAASPQSKDSLFRLGLFSIGCCLPLPLPPGHALP